MAIWRTLGGVVLALSAIPGVWAQPVPLIEAPAVGDCYRIQLDMHLTGTMTVNKDGKPVPLKLAASARHAFPERILAVDTDGLPQKTARVYETAGAAITVEGGRAERTLRPERSLQVAQRAREQTVVYSPVGPLTREEVHLTSEHLNTLVVTGLLPGRAVSVGDTWKVSNAVAQALCNFEGLTAQDLTCKLETVADNVATVAITGSATGIDLGALAKLRVQGSYRFDLGQRRLAALAWKQQDQREQGPVSPKTDIEMTATLTRTRIEQPAALSDVALIKVPDRTGAAPEQMTHLYYGDPKARFNLHYGRDWQIVGQTENHLVLRLMDRGDFVAQATVTPWTKAAAGAHLSAEEFRQAMAATPGWEQGEELQAGEIPLDAGCWGYRISAVGELDGLRVTQNFYLVASPAGEQVVVSFTLNPSQVEKLGTRDLSFVGSLDFPPAPKDM